MAKSPRNKEAVTISIDDIEEQELAPRNMTPAQQAQLIVELGHKEDQAQQRKDLARQAEEKMNELKSEIQKLDPEKMVGDWIPTTKREDFIKHYRLKKNMEIKFTKGYDLYKARLDNWVNSTQEMKENYDEMKREAQVEEYKFMEKVMNQFDYKQREVDIKRMFV